MTFKESAKKAQVTLTELPFIQSFLLKFIEIQMTWFKIQIFCPFEFGRDFYIKVLFWLSNSDSFLFVQIFSHIHSDFVSDQSGRSEVIANTMLTLNSKIVCSGKNKAECYFFDHDITCI